ncbi:hypothetical protein IEQ34_009144 [Dendrobium chrysotoxum]|uniref:X8 domain-containing protein n=1 Tax=Dendrobium chrysotoxum TaxID=161865 RepID=A0AAV7H1H2_DENCH|nr:hypothetical protein IEQ34_009144 [Dendrobium chrysotoxum]
MLQAKRWCIAYPGANPGNLQRDINNICSSIDCSSIKPGGSCYQPNDLVSHASVVFNLYYKAHSSQPSACNFGGDAMFSLADPCKDQFSVFSEYYFSTVVFV